MRATVIKAPAGQGKTREFAKRAASSPGVVEVHVPTHRLAREWRDAILAENPLKRVQIILGRSAVRQPIIPTGAKAKKALLLGASTQPVPLCLKHKLAEEVSKAGMAVYPNLCNRSQGKGVAPLKCQHHDYCDYLGQFYPADVYIYTHAHLALDRGVRETWIPDEVIIDESFFACLIQKVTMPFALLTHASIPVAAQSLCRDVAAALAAGSSLQARFATARKRRGGLTATLRALKPSAAMSPADTDAQQRAALRLAVMFEPLRKLISQLAAETLVRPTPLSAVYNPTTGDIVLHHRRPITRFDRKDGTQPNVFILDASASEHVIGRFFEIDKFVRWDLERRAYVVQCHSTRCSTTSMVPSKNTNPKSAADAAHRIAEVEALITRLAAQGKRVLVVGPVAVVGNPKTSQPSLIAVPAHCELAHFNAVRGVDHWKDFDIIVIIGRNEPPITEIEDIARALHFDNPQPLQLTGNWDYEVRGYRMPGEHEQIGVETAVHADARVQDVAEQLRENESLQAIDRLRLLRNIDKKLVIVLSNLPLDIDVDETRTWDELMHGTRLERALDASGGVLPLNPTWLAANFPASWPTAGAAKKDVWRATKRGHSSNINTIRKMSPLGFEYRPDGQRQWSRCLSSSDDAGLVATTLKGLLGQDVTIRPAKPRP